MINTLRKINKFFTNNWCNKTIIKKNKNKIKLSINITLDEFLKEIVILNIILFAKTRIVMVRKNNVINYDNYHWVVNNIVDVLKFI